MAVMKTREAKAKKVRPCWAWFVVDADGTILPWTCRNSRVMSVDAMIIDELHKFGEVRRVGYTVRRLRISE